MPINLRAIEIEDLGCLRDWRNDLMDNFRQWRYLNMLNQHVWLEEITFGIKDIMLAVEDGSGQLVGVVGLTYVDWVRRSAEVSIYIGRGYWSRGYGSEALRAIINYGFGELCLHRIYSEIFKYNTESLALFEKAGFVREGVSRDGHFGAGSWHSCIVLSMLEDEWKSLS